VSQRRKCQIIEEYLVISPDLVFLFGVEVACHYFRSENCGFFLASGRGDIKCLEDGGCADDFLAEVVAACFSLCQFNIVNDVLQILHELVYQLMKSDSNTSTLDFPGRGR